MNKFVLASAMLIGLTSVTLGQDYSTVSIPITNTYSGKCESENNCIDDTPEQAEFFTDPENPIPENDSEFIDHMNEWEIYCIVIPEDCENAN